MSTKSVVFSAHSCSDYGDAPTCAIHRDSAALLADVQRVQKLICENRLTEARLLCDVEWLPESTADELRLQCGELVVVRDAFWFSNRPKHADYNIETSSMTVKGLEEAVASDVEIHFHESHPGENLQACFEDAESDSDEE